MTRSVLSAIFVAAIVLSSASPVIAMDRWSALSMIESGDNDCAVGLRGEISRFQILPTLWPGGNPRNGLEALSAAKTIMQSRLEHFEKIHGRTANDFEFYVLWNAPWEVNHPSKSVTARARRFANLVQRDDLASR